MIRALTLVFGLLAAIHSAVAADGRALVVAGQVMLERAAAGAAALPAGAEIRSGDLIRTGSDGRVQIRFSDGSIVALQPGTVFRIDEYRYEANERRAFFYLLRGALRTVTGAIGKTNHDAEYRMKTPTATVGVRGTEYVAEQTVCDPQCAPGPRAGLRVAVTQGRIALITDAGTLEVDTGESAEAESAAAPAQPTERGPVLPPISYAPSRERTAGTTATAAVNAGAASPQPGAAAGGITKANGAPGANDASPQPAPSVDAVTTQQDWRAPFAGGGAGVEAAVAADPVADASPGAWPGSTVIDAGTPAAAVSPNERRSPDGVLLPVVERLAPGEPPPAGGGAGSGPGDGDAAGPDPDSGVPGDEPTPAPSSALSAGVRVVAPDSAPGTGLALRVLDPWGLPIGTRVREGSLELDGDIRLSRFEWCRFDALCRIAKGNTKIREAGHDAWTSWGRWSGGQAVATSSDANLQIAGNEGLHYLVGVPSTTVPTSGVFGYSLIGATQATLSGGGQTGAFGGRVAVAFSPSGARVGIDASVSFANGAYRFATPGGVDDPARSTLATGVGHAFNGELSATGTRAPLDCAPSCPVRVDGGLFGPDAARVGITYRITDTGGGSTISGVGVFGKKNP